MIACSPSTNRGFVSGALAVGVSLAGCLLAPTYASAGSDPLSQKSYEMGSPDTGHVSVRVGAGTVFTELPAISYGEVGWPPNTSGLLFELRPDISTEFLDGRIEYLFPKFDHPRWIGRQLRVDISGSWWNEEQRAWIHKGPGTTATFVSVDGSRQILFGAGSRSARTTAEYHGGEAVVRLRSDFHVGPRLTVSPSLGIVVGHRRQRYELDISTPFAGGTMENPIDVRETVTNSEVGGELGLELGTALTNWFSLQIGIWGAALRSKSRLRAQDCLGNAVAIGGKCDGGFYQTWVDARDTETNIRGHSSLGATLALGFGDLSVTGFGGWESHMPGIRNPSSANREPASIRHRSNIHYGWLVSFQFPLN